MTDLRTARRSRWLPPAIAAAAILGLVTLAIAVFGGRHAPRAGEMAAAPIAHRFAAAVVGPAWRLTRLQDEFGTMAVLPAPNPYDTATLTFRPNGELDGNDGVNGIGAKYRVTPDGYVVRGPVMIGAVGLGGPDDSPTARIEAAIDACSTDSRVLVTLAIHGNTMTLHAGGRTLVLVRTYPVLRH